MFDNEEKTKKYLECRDKIGILDSTVLSVIEDDTINYTNEKTKLGYVCKIIISNLHIFIFHDIIFKNMV